MDEAAPAAGAAAEKKRRLLRRVPTPLVVTTLGIALTAWLLPAFTRQWDDRQKAQELKANTVSQMAAATADAVLQSKRVQRQAAEGESVKGPFRSLGAAGDARDRRALDDDAGLSDAWLHESIKIEAKLRAYF